MMSTRPTGLCESGRRRRRTGCNGWCPIRRPRGYCCRAISPTERRFPALGGTLFLSESRRNRAAPLSLWTWSKVVRRLALAADLPQFSTHTTRHLCLTDLARMGWELHAIATFAGHRSTDSTLAYIHLSGRDLADKLSRGMEQIHGWRVRTLARLGEPESGAVEQ